ncbi:hypothetical protein PVK06_029834 [Gossypium arboreum]|uniref:Uncharacterized protein n=1 Tax=Gossypium arboreum TaxID=29729 RepID=A0ABR0NM49_GOSAR|nr:hypothetical protein PVK06_029834 [Gossypium arboreum]
MMMMMMMKSLHITWNDEDITTCSKSSEEHLSNYVAFTSKVNMEDIESDTDETFEGMSDVEFLKTYKTMLNKWEMIYMLTLDWWLKTVNKRREI